MIDDIHSEEKEKITEPPMSLNEVLKSHRRVKDICITLDKECGDNVVEQCRKLYCLVENYAVYRKTAMV